MADKPMKIGFHAIELNKTIWQLPTRYDTLSIVGSGAHGQVSSAMDKQNNVKVAIKKLARPFQSHIHAKRTYREVRMLKHMNHENIIGLIDIFSPATSLEDFDDVYLVTQLMATDLNKCIINQTQSFSDDHVQFLVYQILRGLKYVHSANVIHRDLKPSNVGIREDCGLKILDFGLARHTNEEMTDYVVTRWYRAPEIILNMMHYNQAVDVWSVGCIMAELLTRVPLFRGADYIDQLTRIMSLVGTPGPELLAKITSYEARRYIMSLPKMEKKDLQGYFHHASPPAIDLLERMLDLDPDKRITAVDALAHSYLQQYADPADEPGSEVYDQSFEDKELDIEQWKKLVYDEVHSFTPRPLPEME